jgi:hypothetical protein
MSAAYGAKVGGCNRSPGSPSKSGDPQSTQNDNCVNALKREAARRVGAIFGTKFTNRVGVLATARL